MPHAFPAVLILFSVSLLGFFPGPALTGAEPTEAERPSDRILFRFMNEDERMRFSEGNELIREGRQNIQNGRALVARRPSPMNPRYDVRRDHQEGRERIALGEGQVTQGEALMESARAAAFDRWSVASALDELLETDPGDAAREQTRLASPEPTQIFLIEFSLWEDFLAVELEELFQRLSDTGIRRVAVMPVLLSDTLVGQNIDAAGLENSFWTILSATDRGRRTLIRRESTRFFWDRLEDQLHFREGVRGEPSEDTAYILVELAHMQNRDAIVSLRALASQNLLTVFSRTALLPNFAFLPPASRQGPEAPPTLLNFFGGEEFFNLLRERREVTPLQFLMEEEGIRNSPMRLFIRQFFFEKDRLRLSEKDAIAALLQKEDDSAIPGTDTFILLQPAVDDDEVMIPGGIEAIVRSREESDTEFYLGYFLLQ